MYTVTGLTGPAGCSKTTLAELIRDHLADDPTRIVAIDTSQCLKNSRKQETAAGLALLQMIEDQKRGLILPATPVMNSIRENFAWISEHVQPLHILLAGSTRSVQESIEWVKASRTGFASFRCVLIQCTRPEVDQGIMNRIMKGEIRGDEGEAAKENRWSEYNDKVIPGVKALPRQLVSYTARSKPIKARLYDVVNHMELPDNIRKRWLRKLDERSHPIHAAICEIEHDKAAQVEKAAELINPHDAPVYVGHSHQRAEMALRA